MCQENNRHQKPFLPTLFTKTVHRPKQVNGVEPKHPLTRETHDLRLPKHEPQTQELNFLPPTQDNANRSLKRGKKHRQLFLRDTNYRDVSLTRRDARSLASATCHDQSEERSSRHSEPRIRHVRTPLLFNVKVKVLSPCYPRRRVRWEETTLRENLAAIQVSFPKKKGRRKEARTIAGKNGKRGKLALLRRRWPPFLYCFRTERVRHISGKLPSTITMAAPNKTQKAKFPTRGTQTFSDNKEERARREKGDNLAVVLALHAVAFSIFVMALVTSC